MAVRHSCHRFVAVEIEINIGSRFAIVAPAAALWSTFCRRSVETDGDEDQRRDSGAPVLPSSKN
jgi:hypothetical protein